LKVTRNLKLKRHYNISPPTSLKGGLFIAYEHNYF
jgi:hypothetical protein